MLVAPIVAHRFGTFSEKCPTFFGFAEALKLFRSQLGLFEQGEIQEYSEIWFLGLEAKKVDGVQGASQNNGYDDEHGSYIKACLTLCSFMTQLHSSLTESTSLNFLVGGRLLH